MMYYLDGHEVKMTDDLSEWVRACRSEDRRVGGTVVGMIAVSTVFFANPPAFFETMIFAPGNADLDLWSTQYRTWDAAQSGHDAVVAALTQGEALPDDVSP